MSEVSTPVRAIDRAAMRVVLPILDRYATSPLRIWSEPTDYEPADDTIEIGLGHARGENRGPDFVVRHPAVWRAIGRRGVAALGETYADGWWTTTNLEGVIQFFVGLVEALPLAPNVDPITRRVRPEQTRSNAIGTDDPVLLAYVLDKTMFTGTGRYGTPGTDLYSAALARFSEVCDTLDLQSGDKVLELGTGWGPSLCTPPGPGSARSSASPSHRSRRSSPQSGWPTLGSPMR